MATSKKGRSKTAIKTSQSTTLLNFFTPGTASSSSKSSKALSVKKPFNPKSETKGQPTVCKSRPLTSPEDIIVIDSDDDYTPVVTNRKRRRVSTSSGEIEFVEGVVVERKLANKTNIRHAQNSRSQILSQGKGEHSIARKSSVDAVQPISFGDPSFPVGPMKQSSHSASLEVAPSPNTISFGDPTLLPGRILLNSSNECSASSAIPPCLDDSADNSIAIDIDLSEEWGTGDDEQVLVEDHGDQDFDDLDEMAAEPLDNLASCPVCERQLPAVGIEEHVNQCLATTPSTSSPVLHPSSSIMSRATKAPQTLIPLSSLQTPHMHGPVQLQSCDGKTKSSGSNAFSLLMTSHKENEAWKEASVAEDRNFRPTKGNGGRRKAPFYKILQGMPIAVDAFRYGTIPGVTAYFLTHAHSDHYTNLASNWKSGPIYCSEGTANLIIHMLSVDPKWVHPLPWNVPTIIPDTGGVRVTLIEANHCPGSCLFFYEGLQTVNAGDSAYKSAFIGSSKTFRYLHCGDFRASPRHVQHPAVKGKHIDHIYLDTTYLDPKYTFPPQPQVISACAELAARLVSGLSVEDGSKKISTMDSWVKASPGKDKDKEKAKENILVVVGTYSIGKERIVKAIAHALHSKVYCDPRKTAILRCQADPELHALLTSNPLDASVHIVPLGTITSDKLKPYVARFKGKFSRAIGFRPTGWTYTQPAGTDQMPSIASIVSRSQQRSFTYANLRPARNSTPALQLYGVPYSEHSSFFELTCFAMSVDWGRMIATVNVGSENSRGKMGKWFEKWEVEKKKRGKGEIVPYRHADYW